MQFIKLDSKANWIFTYKSNLISWYILSLFGNEWMNEFIWEETCTNTKLTKLKDPVESKETTSNHLVCLVSSCNVPPSLLEDQQKAHSYRASTNSLLSKTSTQTYYPKSQKDHQTIKGKSSNVLLEGKVRCSSFYFLSSAWSRKFVYLLWLSPWCTPSSLQ